MPEGRHRARSQGPRRPRGQRPGRLRGRRRAGQERPRRRSRLTGQAEVFRRQAASCDGRSPTYAALCRRLADEPLVGEVAPDLRWDAPLRLLGAVHYLALAGQAPDAFASWDAFRQVLSDERAFVRRFMAERGVQTNEVRRSWFLLPAFLQVARLADAGSLDLVELGASAGFNLIWDRYRYRYEQGSWGPERAPLALSGQERRPVPADLLRLRPRVRNRVGVDRSPLDATSGDDLRLLEAFTWIGQEERIARIESAAAAVRADPPPLVRGDYVELLPELLARRRPGALTVVYQTASTGYLGDDQRRTIDAVLADAAGRRALGWVSTRSPAADGVDAFALEVAVLPGPRTMLLHADFHGAWLEWL